MLVVLQAKLSQVTGRLLLPVWYTCVKPAVSSLDLVHNLVETENALISAIIPRHCYVVASS